MSIGFFDAVPTDDVTLHGLEKWTIHMYESLGWMTLAYENGREDKVIAYITSIKKLKLSIENRMKIITNEDAKLDLLSLLSKIRHLTKITTKLFDKETLKKSICDKCAHPIQYDDHEHNDNKIKQEGGSKTKKNQKSYNNKQMLNNNTTKKTSKTQSKKLSKKSSKISALRDEPLIKKLSKKSSKKSSKKLSKKSLHM